MIVYHDIEHGTEDWFRIRWANIGGSISKQLFTDSQTLLVKIVSELTEPFELTDSPTTAAMDRGTEMEPVARGCYEAHTGFMVQEATFCRHPTIDWYGASPDGFVGDDGLIEIKCPNTKQHVEFLRTGKPESGYQWQMLCQMECTGRNWCDFVSFDDRMPTQLQYSTVRFYRDDKRIQDMLSEVKTFIEELNNLETEMRKRMGEAA